MLARKGVVSIEGCSSRVVDSVLLTVSGEVGEEACDEFTGLCAGFGEVVVDDNGFKMFLEGQFVFGFVDPCFEGLGGFCAAAVEASAEFVYGGGLNENGQGMFGVLLLYVYGAFDVDVEDGDTAEFPNAFKF